ncbi:MAG: type I methionyl aminopeptidase [Microgenomates group bacterium]
MVIIKTPSQIEGIRQSCQLAAQTLEYTASFIKQGISTQFLDDQASEFIRSHGAIAAPLGYNGFPKSICTSINNVVCHGIPSPTEILNEGDIINVDITTILNGYYGDTSATFPVGKVSALANQLIKATHDSLDLAINSLHPSKGLNASVGQVIEKYVAQFGFTPVRDLGGHGVGLKFHEDPFVFHFATSDQDTVLKSGMIFTIEPMINASSNWHVTLDPIDHWTVRTADGSLSAQFEHTILITDTGSEILTLL